MARIVILLAVVYLLSFGVLLLLEDSLLYHPVSAADDWRAPPQRLAAPKDVELLADGGRIHAWWSAPDDWDATKGAVLFCHGNGGNLSWWGRVIDDWHEHRSEAFLIFDYPGYGKSEGQPSEGGCYAAGSAAYTWLTEIQQVPGDRVLLVGQSLGTGVATHLALGCRHRALVLLSAFTSMPDMAAEKLPMFPGRWFIHNNFDNLGRIDRCHRPLLVVHGVADELVPIQQGERLFAAANPPKKFLPLDGVGHRVKLDDQFFRTLQALLDEEPSSN
jgi:fermentation-respiration switch protein FrsA (DUF1100 family)